MTGLGTTGRFTDRNVHLFKETLDGHARTHCGLRERSDIWTDPGADVTCGYCFRRLAERVNEVAAKLDAGT